MSAARSRDVSTVIVSGGGRSVSAVNGTFTLTDIPLVEGENTLSVTSR
jgi:hypothetical protein